MSNPLAPTFCGIDFGTSNSSVSIIRSGIPQVVPIDKHSPHPLILRSLIYLNPEHQQSVGYDAINRYLTDLSTLKSVPLRLVETSKKVKVMTPTGSGVMKADWVPEIIEVDDSGRGRLLQSLKSVLTSQLFTGTSIFGKFYTLEELLTILLTEIKTRAETELDHELTSAVIGRPVRYVGTAENKIALDRMHQIALKSGFKHVEFEYEPVGAALNYGINITDNQNILVYDFGGGTLDVCIMKLPEKKIIAVSGRGIGGDLLDSRLVKSQLLHHFGADTVINGKFTFPRHFFSAFDSWYQTTLQKTIKNIESLRTMSIQSNNPPLINNLISLIENDYGFEFFQSVDTAKISLSDNDSYDFKFKRPSLYLSQILSRANFESSIETELIESEKCIFESITQAGLTPATVDKVILTGGSSQVPMFINQIRHIFGADKIVTSDHFTSVASGLALRAQNLFSN
ncbi:Hsp70 family protein [Candidatus Shapirobacteria bacterium]|nr:Hsp70 family protein [Candidatus Shapirobacteria bacterium]